MTGTTAAAAANTTTLSMKLLVDTKAKRVLFAEASKEVVDFLFSLLALPIGTAVKLLGEGSMVGGAGNLYASVERLDDTYVQPGAAKDALLCPVMAPSPAAASNCSLLGLPESAPPKACFSCNACVGYVTDTSGTKCPGCANPMATESKYVSPTAAAAAAAAAKESGNADHLAAQNGGAVVGFVRGVVTYTVMDSLSVSPMSAISSITLLNTFAVTDLGALQEKTVQIGYKEGLEILKASLQSKTVLTDVFLVKKSPNYA